MRPRTRKTKQKHRKTNNERQAAAQVTQRGLLQSERAEREGCGVERLPRSLLRLHLADARHAATPAPA